MNKYESKALRLLKAPDGAPVRIRKDIKEYAKMYAEDMIQVLYEIAADEENFTKDRITAAEAILNRAYGKPRNEVEDAPTIDMVNVSKLSTAELTKMLLEMNQEDETKVIEYTPVEQVKE